MELDDQVVKRLLTFYPEEGLIERRIFANAFRSGEIKKSDLQREAATLFIPWQMFLLEWPKLQRQLHNIESNREDKIKITEVSRRSGRGVIVPNRVIDRCIRAQNFLVSTEPYILNRYNNLLRGRSVRDAVDTLITYFGISRRDFWDKPTKERGFDYLVERIESGNLNVARGTSEGRLVPSSRNHRSLYKNISGFCLRDSRVPFIFVNMNMADEEEPVGRRIYTLVYLTTLIGLGVYTLTRDWRPDRTPISSAEPYLKLAHDIASEFLLPSSAIDRVRGTKITVDTVMGLSNEFKLTPTAVLFRLWKEKCISISERDTLMQTAPPKKSRARSPHIENAVRKFNGNLVFKAVNTAFSANRITQNQAQYILFGRIRRDAWRNYRARLGL